MPTINGISFPTPEIAMFTLLLACAPATIELTDIVVESQPGTGIPVTTDSVPADPGPAYQIMFDGNVEQFPVVMFTCVNDCGSMTASEAGYFDRDGRAELFTTCPEGDHTHFNVWDDYGGNTNPNVLGTTVVEDHGDWEANATSSDDNPSYNLLYLWVFENGYPDDELYEDGTLEPVTTDGTSYFEGGLPPEPFNSIFGWEYGRPDNEDPT
ncbi:MAG: hypothetical protein HY565_03810 [Candidatus Kerfeldbacteria bacterium]|nr:hypothetical protein [Candidatus Kerfeldbacteria bacterium]